MFFSFQKTAKYRPALHPLNVKDAKMYAIIGYSRKKNNKKKTGLYFMIFTFLKIPLEFLIFYLPLQIPDKTKLHSWQFHEILLDTLEIPHYLVILFLGHYFFVTPPPPLLEISCLQSPCLFFLD